MKAESDVLVIGGGAVGVCSAYYLGKKGVQVSLVEREEFASGCSGANAGLIVPSFIIPLAKPGALRQTLKWFLKPESPFSIKPRLDASLLYWLWQHLKACKPQKMHQGIRVLHDLNYASAELMDHLITQKSLACHYRKNGWLMVYKTHKTFQESLEEADLLKFYDVGVQIMSAPETLELEPTLNPNIAGGLFFPEDAHLDPAKFVKTLAESLSKRDVHTHEKTEVLAFETADGRITTVRTNLCDFRPKHVVLAAGAWSSGLAKKLGFHLPQKPAKGYSLSIKRPETGPTSPLYLSESKVAVTPLGDTLRLAGTLELAGMDFSLDKRRVNSIRRTAEDYVVGIENKDIIEIRSGLRPCTPDGLPIIGRIPGYDNLILATGHCMLGITLAPITGKLISQLVLEQPLGIDLEPLSISRFKKSFMKRGK